MIRNNPHPLLRSTRPAALFLCLVLCLSLALFAVPAPAETTPQAPDYSRAECWLAKPEATSHPVDVFWVYPTVYAGKTLLAEVDDPQMRTWAEKTLVAQASVFKDSADLYAPLYRQASISVLSMGPEDKAKNLAVGLSDVEAAFAYYLKHYNRGRPFILAGHSQGSNLLTDFLKKHADDPAVVKGMVAAYLIGWSVTTDDCAANPSLKVCGSSDQTGCVVTYNCVAAGAQKKAPTILPGAVVVNPLSWRTDGELVPASKNLGAVFFGEDGAPRLVAHYTSAQIVDGGLVVDPPDPASLDHMPFGPGVYHSYDYTFFYQNLKANIARRVSAFLRSRIKLAGRETR